MSDVPLGVFLSGGLDSSAVAALTTKIRGDRIQTFAVGYGEEAVSEIGFARTVANHIGSEHHEVRMGREEFFQMLPKLIWHEDEPLAWPSSVALYFVARLARERVKVVLTGEGSDETLAGYGRYTSTLLNARMDAIYRSITTVGLRSSVRKLVESAPVSATLHRKLQHTFVLRNGNSWPSIYFDNFFSAFSAEEQAQLLTPAALAQAGDTYHSSMNAWERSRGDLLHRMLSTDIHTYLVELLMKQDQMSMAASIESRVPFLDHELVEFTAKIPAQYSVRGFAGKCILKEAMEDLLPKPVIYRKKMGFPTPWDHWLAGPQLDDLERMLLEPRSTERGLFNAEAVRRLFAEHRVKSRDHGNRIWRLLNFELWQRIMIDGDSPV
jgi:asparagine synthase (glutamine-hydrolysing)